MTAEGAFEFVEDVTSDLTFEATGATLEALFAAAASALLAATVGAPEAVRERTSCTLEFEESELDLLMLRFLNELIYLRDADGLVLRPVHLNVSQERDLRLRAQLRGEPFDPDRHLAGGEVKAATAHGLCVEPCPSGFRARVTLDV